MDRVQSASAPPTISFVDVRRYVEQEDLPSLEGWLQSGGDPNFLDERGRTLLMIVVAQDFIPAVELLICHRADCDRQQEHGATALALASMMGSVKCVQILLEANASLEITDARGLSPIQYVQAKVAEYDKSGTRQGHDQSQRKAVLALLLKHQMEIRSQGWQQSSMRIKKEQ